MQNADFHRPHRQIKCKLTKVETHGACKDKPHAADKKQKSNADCESFNESCNDLSQENYARTTNLMQLGFHSSV